jgi:hypothetical protein
MREVNTMFSFKKAIQKNNSLISEGKKTGELDSVRSNPNTVELEMGFKVTADDDIRESSKISHDYTISEPLAHENDFSGTMDDLMQKIKGIGDATATTSQLLEEQAKSIAALNNIGQELAELEKSLTSKIGKIYSVI